MRLSTTQMTSAGVRELLLRQADIQHTQLQLATQKRVLKPSDDPVAATSISFLQTEIAQLEQFNVNGDAAKSNNELEESVLASVTDILFRIRSLTVEMGNGTYGEDEINSVAVEMKERLGELLGLANTKNANGDYLFSGSKVKTQPFARDAAGNYVYNGDQNQRMLRVSSGVVVAVSDPGFDVFVDTKNGNGKFITSANTANTGSGIISPGDYQAPPNFLAEPYTITFGTDINGNTTYTVTGDVSAGTIVPATIWQEGDQISFNGITTQVAGAPVAGDQFHIAPSSSEDLFTTIQTAIDAAESFSQSPANTAKFLSTINSVQETLEGHMQNVDVVRGRVGSRLNAVDSEFNSNLSLLITSKSTLSDVQDLDVVEASTRFSQQLVVLEAAQASFVRVQGLNLFNFL
ncbi:flagellar hook-associated protein FlgL [Aliikangiella coralliicola]|uniref:Flagellar hook-associated protein 3 n=1 Tax=Aliikangiella coralliicola TaxID=2592383 RepID=A0A545U5W9_9GAMM|nr:flagellar hook-associated protein FlgL [Aliikangiella coralliicola]TQV84864.1 flagellar hook-associated protein 3 [Aliikangiella coralliicola]